MSVALWTRAWIGLGSNVGARRATLDGAVQRLRRVDSLRVGRVSSWHCTEPVGGPEGQRRYRNGVAELETCLAASELLETLLAVEAEFGRERAVEVANGPRTLDLDLLLFGDQSIASDTLEVPHPRMEERTFVLAPLCELEPELRLPISGVRACDRLRELVSTR